MRMLRELRTGQAPSREDYNNLVRTVNMIMNMRGTDGILTDVSPNGITIKGDANTLFKPRNAYPIDDVTSSATVVCFIDTDSGSGVVPGPRVTVDCEVVGGSSLNAAIPRLEDGDRLTIWNDNGTWRPFYPFQATKDC